MNLPELGKILRGEPVSLAERTIGNLDEMSKICAYLRESGYEITSTTGVWDMLHIGHCRYLAETRSKGHIIIVEVDSDELVRMRKPDNLHRPVVPLPERLEMLSHMRWVDLLFPLYPCENTTEFIEVMKPDVFVVSEPSEDSKEPYLNRVRPPCGEVVVLAAQATISTTRRVQRMMRAGGIEQLMRVRDMVSGLIDAANGQVSEVAG
ncbi:MAG: adenylyltransferase/cytidyltransferase family protein, partial [Patescibacteria group bacterium]